MSLFPQFGSVVSLFSVALLVGCNSGTAKPAVCGTEVVDDDEIDAGLSGDAGIDAGAMTTDAGRKFSCQSFDAPAGWVTAAGFRAVVVASADAGLNQPVALTFAGGDFGGDVYVVNQGNQSVLRLNPDTGKTNAFALSDGGGLFTTIEWDAHHQFDGQLYIGDQGSNLDGDSSIFRADTTGALELFSGPGGVGMDDVYGLVFTPQLSGWPAGLLVAGDTDAASENQVGLIDADGDVALFSNLAGVQGFAVDITQKYGASVLASMPNGGGFSGTDAVTRLMPDGGIGGDIVTGIPGIHAITVAPEGPFNGLAFAASWQTGEVFAIELDGGTREIASGLSLTNFDGNILAFSPDGKILLVADRLANRVVCIEPL